MAAATLDLDAYCARIGYSGSRSPTRQTLDGLLLHHVQAIPFENLDVLLGRPISLEPEALQRKLVHERRGGYCFEQNGLLLAALGQLGFSVQALSARVRYQRPREYTPPRTHLFVRVELEGTSWLADVGVGSMSPTCALRLQLDVEQPTPHEPRRVIREGDLYYHQVKLGAQWHDVAEFTLEQMPPIDRELANWFTSAHPQSHFKSRLVVARAGPNGERVALLNRELTRRRALDGSSVVRVLEHPDALLQVLADEFDLHFPQGTRFDCPGLDWP